MDLEWSVLFSPDDPRLDQILTQVKRERDGQIARLRRDQKKFAAMKARDRRQDITAVPRVQDLEYPLVMQVSKYLSKEFRS